MEDWAVQYQRLGTDREKQSWRRKRKQQSHHQAHTERILLAFERIISQLLQFDATILQAQAQGLRRRLERTQGFRNVRLRLQHRLREQPLEGHRQFYRLDRTNTLTRIPLRHLLRMARRLNLLRPIRLL